MQMMRLKRKPMMTIVNLMKMNIKKMMTMMKRDANS